MNLKIYIDGNFYPEAEAKISVFDHGLLYGDGVFEGAGLDSTGGVLATVGVPPLPPPQDARVLHPPLPDVLQLEVNMLQVLPLPPELSS